MLLWSLVDVQNGIMGASNLLMQFSLYINLFNMIAGIMKTYLTIYDFLYFLNLQRNSLTNGWFGMSTENTDNRLGKHITGILTPSSGELFIYRGHSSMGIFSKILLEI